MSVGLRFVNGKISMVDLYKIVNDIIKGNLGKYNGYEYLGSGGFGEVYGYNNYAIKRFTSDLTYKDEENDISDVSDAYILHKLQSVSNIPNIYGLIGKTAMIVDRIDGITLDDYIRGLKKNEITPFMCDNFYDEYDKMIKEIFNLGFVPCDLNNNNIMICRKTGLPKIVDVGLFFKLDKSKVITNWDGSINFNKSNSYKGIMSEMEFYIGYIKKIERKMSKKIVRAV